jgi:hypothetical protein
MVKIDRPGAVLVAPPTESPTREEMFSGLQAPLCLSKEQKRLVESS